MRNQKVKMLVEMAVSIAIALVLNKLSFPLPQGGSISLEMLPIIIVSFRWGVGAGFMTGLAEGLLQLLFGATIVHPAQLIIDYPLPFALVGLAGLFKTALDAKGAGVKIFLGTLLGGILRFLCHLISGVVFFGQYAPEGQNVWIYSTIYNGTYMIPSILVCIIVLLAIRKPLAKIGQ